jgi:hypothetical protein
VSDGFVTLGESMRDTASVVGELLDYVDGPLTVVQSVPLVGRLFNARRCDGGLISPFSFSIESACTIYTHCTSTQFYGDPLNGKYQQIGPDGGVVEVHCPL